jgi:hypothetical protein
VNKCFKSSRGLLSSILIYLIACQLDKLQIQVTSKILPPYLRRTSSLDALIPALYLKGISTGDFEVALRQFLERMRRDYHLLIL